MDINLRPWSLSDIDSLVKYANNYSIARFMTNTFPHPYTNEHGLRFIKMASDEWPVRLFAIEIEGEAAGSIGIHPQNDIMCKNAELGYWLGEKYHGKGIITKVIPQMIAFGFNTFDINRIYARPFGNNFASQRVLEKCGFMLEARIEKNIFKNGEFHDEMIYAVRKS